MNIFNDEFTAANLSWGISDKVAGYIFSKWERISNVLIFVQEGELQIKTESTVQNVRKGECIFIPQGTKGSTYFIDKRNLALIFTFDILDKKADCPLIHFSMSDSCYNLSRQITDDILTIPFLNRNYMFSVFYKLCYYLQTNDPVEKKYQKIHMLIREIEKNYHLNLKLSDYSKMLYISESSMRSLFKEYTGKSIIDYRNYVRIKKAEEFILGGLTVAEASDKVGFSSPSFYCRIRKKYHI